MDKNQAQSSFDYWKFAEYVWSKRKFVFGIVTLATVLTVGISLLLSNKYRSTAVVLPDTQGGKMGNLGGLSDLAAMAGVSVGGDKSWVELYPSIILSEAVLKNVIYAKFKSNDFKDSVNLIEYWEFNDKDPLKNYDKTYESLKKALEVNADKRTKMLTVSLIMYESQLAADIINKVLRELDNFVRTKRLSSASERRKWIDNRLQDVKSDLERAENRLKDFRERNRSISNSPQLLLEQQRLLRDVEINSTIFVELKKQLELAKIDEINTMPIINILDNARQTSIKESPRRSIIVMVVFLLSFAGSVGYIGLMNVYQAQVKEFKEKLDFILRKR